MYKDLFGDDEFEIVDEPQVVTPDEQANPSSEPTVWTTGQKQDLWSTDEVWATDEECEDCDACDQTCDGGGSFDLEDFFG